MFLLAGTEHVAECLWMMIRNTRIDIPMSTFSSTTSMLLHQMTTRGTTVAEPQWSAILIGYHGTACVSGCQTHGIVRLIINVMQTAMAPSVSTTTVGSSHAITLFRMDN